MHSLSRINPTLQVSPPGLRENKKIEVATTLRFSRKCSGGPLATGHTLRLR